MLFGSLGAEVVSALSFAGGLHHLRFSLGIEDGLTISWHLFPTAKLDCVLYHRGYDSLLVVSRC